MSMRRASAGAGDAGSGTAGAGSGAGGGDGVADGALVGGDAAGGLAICFVLEDSRVPR